MRVFGAYPVAFNTTATVFSCAFQHRGEDNDLQCQFHAGWQIIWTLRMGDRSLVDRFMTRVFLGFVFEFCFQVRSGIAITDILVMLVL